MSIEFPLPGYAPTDIPRDVEPLQAAVLAARLEALGYKAVSSSMTAEPVPVATMVNDIGGAHRGDQPAVDASIPGPCLIGEELVLGNAISLWEKAE